MTASSPLVQTGLLAHRGASLLRPENTLESIAVTAEMGVLWIETDVRTTRDKKLVMVHDSTLDRTTSGSGYVAQTDLAEIQKLDAGSWMGPEFAGMKVPTMKAFLTDICALGLSLQLEFKEDKGREEELVDLVCDELEEYWPADGPSKLFFSGFSERCLRRASVRMPNVQRALALTCVPRDPDRLAEETGVTIMHVQDDFTDEAALEAIRASSVEFGVATVNDPQRARDLLDGGVQQVLTDDPQLLSNNRYVAA
ncbi:glycerophosphoryl diester phosphodiesterase (plasmid) [Parasedimentitalea marina]|uniref:Glycerophosphoryl diester phosphodiesterase n=1 Tax=Parasedimentitalea marina TaxID=2483033 RepID=A0A3T0NAB0_9RHOB|nr:glycerophosphodiester phosphodiesterase family protein [Parasedimentitalea marina]AZV80941.1 glycerophosphoryl diester phosphodiesterase [Parasedimentitalea marina]